MKAKRFTVPQDAPYARLICSLPELQLLGALLGHHSGCDIKAQPNLHRYGLGHMSSSELSTMSSAIFDAIYGVLPSRDGNQ